MLFQVSVYNVPILGLLDSGATHTILDKQGWNRSKASCAMNMESGKECIVANGETCYVEGSVLIPITL